MSSAAAVSSTGVHGKMELTELMDPVERRKHENEASELVKNLQHYFEAPKSKETKPSFKVRRTSYTVLDSKTKIVSWKFNDWDYGKESKPLPTNARGLFTREFWARYCGAWL
jgi:hypothetical protein